MDDALHRKLDRVGHLLALIALLLGILVATRVEAIGGLVVPLVVLGLSITLVAAILTDRSRIAG